MQAALHRVARPKPQPGSCGVAAKRPHSWSRSNQAPPCASPGRIEGATELRPVRQGAEGRSHGHTLHSPRAPLTVTPSCLPLERTADALAAPRLQKRRQSHPRRSAGVLTVPQIARALAVPVHRLYDQITRGTFTITKAPATRLYLFPAHPQPLQRFKALKTGSRRKIGLHTAPLRGSRARDDRKQGRSRSYVNYKSIKMSSRSIASYPLKSA
jgi:hypothetical protein